VLVGNPKILLLDEATSALDAESELIVQEALDSILEVKKITTIIIAHRLSTIRKADKINVIAGGEVVESGTHDELMGSASYYRKLVEKQEGKQDEESDATPSSSRASSAVDLPSLATASMTVTETVEEKVTGGTDTGLVATTTTTTTITDSHEVNDTNGVGVAGSVTFSDEYGNTPEVGLDNMDGASKVNDRVDMFSEAHIQFKHVTFVYPTRPKKRIFNDFNLTIYQGQTIALVGPSGGGKSTTVGLIERFYDPMDGVLEYMGHDVKTLNVSWYRDQIGYVSQEPVLFNDTIARNIAYGAPGATRKEIEEAAIQANAHEFIMHFAEGYETPVGERGTRLSGGQKQRIAIARALVKKPKVLILDEATSALDNESEAIVQAAMDRLMHSRGQTVIIIAHRLSTVRNADSIAVIADGEVVEYGPHDELKAQSHGRYRRLFESSKRSATVASSALYASNVKQKSKRTMTMKPIGKQR
jgi:ABC-type multidrug transport system fused ATPase/permease subunit